jgi:MFS family permease
LVAAGAVAATVVAVLPVFLLGGLAVQVRPDLGLSPAGLGGLVSTYFAASALASIPVGWLVERYGPTRTTQGGVLLAAASMLLIAGPARSYREVLGALLAGGAANAMVQLGSNLSLARSVPPRRMGLSFGVKQAAIPVATLAAGVAVPAVGLTVGWRWAFAGAGVIAVIATVAVPRARSAHRSSGRRDHDVAAVGLWVMASAAALASGTANALGAFLVDSSVARGLGAGLAGGMLALASAVGVISRVLSGWLADRRSGGHLAVLAGMLAAGAVGLALLALPTGAALVAGALLGFGFGWSWPGLLNFAVVRLNPSAPAAATSITQAGVYAGGALGPIGFGALADLSSYSVAWAAAAGLMVVAGGLLLVGRQVIVRTKPKE